MSFKDAIKDSIIEGMSTGDITVSRIAATLGIAILMGLYIYFIYRVTAKGSFYSRGFNKALAIMPLITAGILLAMQSNLVISLGMVGALSIVRFRNAIKEPMDLAFLFWSISVGIIGGAGMFELVFIVSIAVTIVVFLLDLLPSFRAPCLLVISASEADAEEAIRTAVKKYCAHAKVKSRSITQSGLDLILELPVKQEAELVKEVAAVENVTSVNLLNHDGELRF